MLMYNLIEYINNYWKISENAALRDSKSFKSKLKVTAKPPDGVTTKDNEIAVQLKKTWVVFGELLNATNQLWN